MTNTMFTMFAINEDGSYSPYAVMDSANARETVEFARGIGHVIVAVDHHGRPVWDSRTTHSDRLCHAPIPCLPCAILDRIAE